MQALAMIVSACFFQTVAKIHNIELIHRKRAARLWAMDRETYAKAAANCAIVVFNEKLL
jgi:hypothetical protein